MRSFIPKVEIHSSIVITCCLILLFGICVALWFAAQTAQQQYQAQASPVWLDRTGALIRIFPNERGHYALYTTELSPDLIEILLQKEDRYFYYHLGINPISTARALIRTLRSQHTGGASTITQQVSKNILQTEQERTIRNKVRESFYAVALEIFFTKDEILLMYANTAYLGNQLQGFAVASEAYFDTPLHSLSRYQQASLVASLSYPSTRNPWHEQNQDAAATLYRYFNEHTDYRVPTTSDAFSANTLTSFELEALSPVCTGTCQLSIDASLTGAIRNIVSRVTAAEWSRGARNAAVVVLDVHTSEIISIVGSKNPASDTTGDQINMAVTPRPIGSTVKPFIYAAGFEAGLRPYTIVEDREYKYPIATGFPLYPKNFDGAFRGEVTLHEALSNSLNVPSVKVLEYVTLDSFYNFLTERLHFTPMQPLDSYQYGIALGGLEMDLLTLTHYFSLFPNQGTLVPLQLGSDVPSFVAPQSSITARTDVIEPQYTQLVHAIISDRLRGVNQFGLENNLNIETTGYGVKTGTSRDFHDSWVVGYTGDFIVGVWLGNVENEPLDQVTGQSGAGAIWHDVMNYVLSTNYHQGTKVELSAITQKYIDGSTEWSLPGDAILEHQYLLSNTFLITNPFSEDSFEFFEGVSIPLTASEKVDWYINSTYHASGEAVRFTPDSIGTYEIEARTDTERTERIMIYVTEPHSQ